LACGFSRSTLLAQQQETDMTKTIATSKMTRNGFAIKLQQRRGKFDVIYCTGFCWKFLAKGRTEQEASFIFDLEVL